MNTNLKTILAGATALATIGGAWAAISSMTPTARGLLNSGPLPLAGRVEVAQLTTQFQAIQGQMSRQAAQDAIRDRELAAVRQQQLESMLAGARADYAKAPTISGHAYVCALITQIDTIRLQSRLPPIPPCP